MSPDPEASMEPQRPSSNPVEGHRRFLGDYELIHEIARGGMGVVYRAQQLSLGRTVAVKMVHAGGSQSKLAATRLQSEAEAIASLDHPNIVSLYESGVHDAQFFFSMRLVEGPNLAVRLSENTTTTRDLTRILLKSARAVEHAHARGILHRDIKPSNILIDPMGEPQLTDFGLAKFVLSNSDQTQSGSIVGTPSYMAPEQTVSGAEVTTATDIYGLGAILYEILTGRPPFVAETPLETMRRVADSTLEKPRRVNPEADAELEAVCLKCLERDPSKRYASALEFASELERWLAGEPVHVRPVGAVKRLWRWSRRQPALATSLAASVALLCGISIVSSVAYTQMRAANLENERLLSGMRFSAVEHLFQDGSTAEALARLANMSRLHPEESRVRRRLSAELHYGAFTRPTAHRIWNDNSPLVCKATASESGVVVVLTQDGKLRRWDMNQSRLLELVVDLEARVDVADMSKNGSVVAVARNASAVQLIAADGSSKELETPADEYPLTRLVLSEDGRFLATVESEWRVTLWDCESGGEDLWIGDSVGTNWGHRIQPGL